MEMVEARRDGDKVEQRYDLFSGLLDAAQDEQDIEAALSDEELMGGYSSTQRWDRLGFSEIVLSVFPGNMFIFLIAGHEVRSFPFILRCCPQTVHYSPRRIHYVFHLLCWHCILTSKSVCINTSKALCLA